MAPKKVMKAMKKKTADLDERSKAKVSKFFLKEETWERKGSLAQRHDKQADQKSA